jgi:hypothetical protein
MTDEEKVKRAQHAERLLNDDVLKDAIRQVRDKCIEDFKAAKPGDIETLRTARLSFETADRFVNALFMVVRDGQFAKIKIDAEKKSKAKRPLQKA